MRVNWFVEGEGKKEKMTRGGVGGEKMTRGGVGESKEREHRDPITLLFRK